jgi:hypothetical protein
VTLAVAAEAAKELLRTALLAKLACDLEDPALARRAAREASRHARLLSGLDFPAYDTGDEPLPDVGDLLDVLSPPCAADDEAVPA